MTTLASCELEKALSKLEGIKKIHGGYQAKCPCHEDRHQSLSIAEKDGKLMLYCHAGCSFENIIRTLNISRERENNAPIITAIYDYTDLEGKLLYQVIRYHPKNFKQRRPDENGGWIWNLKGIKPTLYHLSEVRNATQEKKLIWIVEGEKDVDNLRKVGQIATTISGGAASKWPPYLVPTFLDATVAIIPDNDNSGKKYAQYVANLLFGWCSSLKVIELPVKDVTDYLSEKSVDSLLNIYHNTSEYVPSGIVTREEFNEFRGINLYLWRALMVRKKESNIKKERTNYKYNNIIENATSNG